MPATETATSKSADESTTTDSKSDTVREAMELLFANILAILTNTVVLPFWKQAGEELYRYAIYLGQHCRPILDHEEALDILQETLLLLPNEIIKHCADNTLDEKGLERLARRIIWNITQNKRRAKDKGCQLIDDAGQDVRRTVAWSDPVGLARYHELDLDVRDGLTHLTTEEQEVYKTYMDNRESLPAEEKRGFWKELTDKVREDCNRKMSPKSVKRAYSSARTKMRDHLAQRGWSYTTGECNGHSTDRRPKRTDDGHRPSD